MINLLKVILRKVKIRLLGLESIEGPSSGFGLNKGAPKRGITLIRLDYRVILFCLIKYLNVHATNSNCLVYYQGAFKKC